MARNKLVLSVQYAVDSNLAPSRKQFREWAHSALDKSINAAEVTLRIVDVDEGRELNAQYRGKDYATNVLTFTFDDSPLVEGMPLYGDLVLCAPVVAKEAQEQGKALDAHYAHLVVHGMLHLQGYDHIEDDEAEEMESLETQIMQQLGFPDPYAKDEA
ncbi:rRNA maturation RNase YbeY [Parachitinimonas caeni]|uniref:Endoribonuclease YbeY n=1 Tax=Parachitinimonas caeni TaxID=3031301 RepID=A0ABT7E1X4_9NEIS|nr:rRNA maturation RNase YbeY [Parachitinimonas caeni]MDK2126316.1 rRNA maturation RNase YbeY [Parachitinimonas caeni]